MNISSTSRTVRVALALTAVLTSSLDAQGAASKSTICLAPAAVQMASGSSADGGTAVRESIAAIRSAGATPHAVAIALDRQEKATENGQDAAWSAVQFVQKNLGLQIASIATLTDLLQYLRATAGVGVDEHAARVAAYRDRYGV